MTCVFKRAPYDDWYFDLYQKINHVLPTGAESYYLWSVDEAWDELVSIKFKSNVVFLLILDSLHFRVEYDPSLQQLTDRAITLHDIFTQNSDIKFIVSTSFDNLQAEISLPNVTFLCHGNLHTNPVDAQTLSIDKNSTVSNTFICLNRMMKMHRFITVSYMLGQNLENFGHISFDSNAVNSYNSWLDKCNWQLTPYQEQTHAPILHHGFAKIKKMGADLGQSLQEVNAIYSSTSDYNNNALNFEQNLKKLYQDSFVQIITEAVFSEPTVMPSEKTAQCFYGANFPIIIGNAGVVKHLRQVGFDMFDDIIDHSYDKQVNRLTRITSAIDANIKILTDIDYAKEKWHECALRFQNNMEFLNNGAASYYSSSVLDQIKKIFHND